MNLFFDICKYMALGFLWLLFGILFALGISAILAMIFQGLNLDSFSPRTIIYTLPIGLLIVLGIYKLIND